MKDPRMAEFGKMYFPVNLPVFRKMAKIDNDNQLFRRSISITYNGTRACNYLHWLLSEER